jgi:hypothetical protein
MEPWRVSVSHGLLDLVLFRMADGKEWCAPELSGGRQPLKCRKLALLERRVGHKVPAPWTTTVPLKDVVPLLTGAEKDRVELSSQRKGRGTLFLVSLEALSELLHHTPRVKAWAAGRTFTCIADLRACACSLSFSLSMDATLPDTTAVRERCRMLVGGGGWRLGGAGAMQDWAVVAWSHTVHRRWLLKVGGGLAAPPPRPYRAPPGP